jgi:hypothetical protein
MDDEHGQHVHYDLTETADIDAALVDAAKRDAEVIDLRERSGTPIR